MDIRNFDENNLKTHIQVWVNKKWLQRVTVFELAVAYVLYLVIIIQALLGLFQFDMPFMLDALAFFIAAPIVQWGQYFFVKYRMRKGWGYNHMTAPYMFAPLSRGMKLN